MMEVKFCENLQLAVFSNIGHRDPVTDNETREAARVIQ